MIFWLKNRIPKDWRDVHRVEHGFDKTAALEGVTDEDEAAVALLVEEVLGDVAGGNGNGT